MAEDQEATDKEQDLNTDEAAGGLKAKFKKYSPIKNS